MTAASNVCVVWTIPIENFRKVLDDHKMVAKVVDKRIREKNLARRDVVGRYFKNFEHKDIKFPAHLIESDTLAAYAKTKYYATVARHDKKENQKNQQYTIIAERALGKFKNRLEERKMPVIPQLGRIESPPKIPNPITPKKDLFKSSIVSYAKSPILCEENVWQDDTKSAQNSIKPTASIISNNLKVSSLTAHCKQSNSQYDMFSVIENSKKSVSGNSPARNPMMSKVSNQQFASITGKPDLNCKIFC